MVDKFPTKRKGSQSLRLTFLIKGNSSEPPFVPLLGSRNNDYDHNCDINLNHNKEHNDDIEDLDNDYNINDQKLELFKDHNKDNCDSQEYYHGHGHIIVYHKNNDDDHEHNQNKVIKNDNDFEHLDRDVDDLKSQGSRAEKKCLPISNSYFCPNIVQALPATTSTTAAWEDQTI